jgi:hypothetical protein
MTGGIVENSPHSFVPIGAVSDEQGCPALFVYRGQCRPHLTHSGEYHRAYVVRPPCANRSARCEHEAHLSVGFLVLEHCVVLEVELCLVDIALVSGVLPCVTGADDFLGDGFEGFFEPFFPCLEPSLAGCHALLVVCCALLDYEQVLCKVGVEVACLHLVVQVFLGQLARWFALGATRFA